MIKIPADVQNTIIGIIITSFAASAKIGLVCKRWLAASRTYGNIYTKFDNTPLPANISSYKNIHSARLLSLSCVDAHMLQHAQKLYLYRAPDRDCMLIKLTSLREVTLERCPLSTNILPSSVTTLHISEYHGVLQLSHLTSLTNFTLQHVLMRQDLSSMTNIVSLNIYCCDEIILPCARNLTSLNISHSLPHKINYAELTNLTRLSAPHTEQDLIRLTNITDLSIERTNIGALLHLPLRKLNLCNETHTGIELLPRLSSLRKLHISMSMQLDILPQCTQLQSLRLYWKAVYLIKTTPMLNITSLSLIAAHDESTCDLAYLPSLTKLRLTASTMRVSNMHMLTCLRSLIIVNFPFCGNDILALTSLTYLKLSTRATYPDNENIDLTHHVNLRKVNLTDCDVDVKLPAGVMHEKPIDLL